MSFPTGSKTTRINLGDSRNGTPPNEPETDMEMRMTTGILNFEILGAKE